MDEPLAGGVAGLQVGGAPLSAVVPCVGFGFAAGAASGSIGFLATFLGAVAVLATAPIPLFSAFAARRTGGVRVVLAAGE